MFNYLQCKTVSVGPEMSARCVVRQSLHVLQNGGNEGDADGDGDNENEGEGRLGSANEFTLCVRPTRDSPPTPLHGIERPHAIQVSILSDKCLSTNQYNTFCSQGPRWECHRGHVL